MCAQTRKTARVDEVIPAAERKKRARAAWAYAGIDQRELAAATGILYGTLKGLLRKSGPAPTTDQAMKIAKACEVPPGFILTGFGTSDPKQAATLLEQGLLEAGRALGQVPEGADARSAGQDRPGRVEGGDDA